VKLVDTHCHVQAAQFDADREVVIQRGLDDLAWLVIIGDNLASSRAALDLTRGRVFATAGIHPHHAAEFSEETLEQVRAMVQHPNAVAIGEIGLDYYYDMAPRDTQLAAFRAQLLLAHELGLPAVIHNRDADADMLEVLEGVGDQRPRGVMHCFSSDTAFLRRCLDLGLHISYTGNVTFPKAAHIRDAAAATPLDRLMVETDAPYLAPIPLRGKRNEPRYVAHTAAAIAQLKGLSLDAFAAATTATAAAFFAR
jgi:TatD DNase family protein